MRTKLLRACKSSVETTALVRNEKALELTELIHLLIEATDQFVKEANTVETNALSNVQSQYSALSNIFLKTKKKKAKDKDKAAGGDYQKLEDSNGNAAKQTRNRWSFLGFKEISSNLSRDV